ncbi:hypothetical protein ACWDT6_19820 [Nocardia grenadensis]
MNTAPSGGKIVLDAATPEEFLALLRAIADASGRSRGALHAQASRLTSMPRSTFYHLLSTDNTALPKNRDQIAAICTASKLSPPQVDRVLQIWRDLGEGKHARRPRTRVSEADEEPLGDRDPLRAHKALLARIAAEHHVPPRVATDHEALARAALADSNLAQLLRIAAEKAAVETRTDEISDFDDEYDDEFDYDDAAARRSARRPRAFLSDARMHVIAMIGTGIAVVAALFSMIAVTVVHDAAEGYSAAVSASADAVRPPDGAIAGDLVYPVVTSGPGWYSLVNYPPVDGPALDTAFVPARAVSLTDGKWYPYSFRSFAPAPGPGQSAQARRVTWQLNNSCTVFAVTLAKSAKSDTDDNPGGFTVRVDDRSVFTTEQAVLDEPQKVVLPLENPRWLTLESTTDSAGNLWATPLVYCTAPPGTADW